MLFTLAFTACQSRYRRAANAPLCARMLVSLYRIGQYLQRWLPGDIQGPGWVLMITLLGYPTTREGVFLTSQKFAMHVIKSFGRTHNQSQAIQAHLGWNIQDTMFGRSNYVS